MLLWVIFAVLTGLAVVAVLAPLSRARGAAVSGRQSDVAVYRDQLREIDADLERGAIAATEAEAARTEVGRRLLAADREARAAAAAAARPPRGLATALIVLIPLVVLTAYLAVGSPDLPGQPLAARLERAPQDQDVALLIARVEEHLAANPGDGRGWEVLAPVYMRLGRFEEAARAHANALNLLGSTPDREADHAEAVVAAEDGMVTARARAALERALAAEPGHPKARYFLAIAAEQDGDTARAAAMWRDFLADSPPDAPWRAVVEARLMALTGETPASGPTPDDVAAAAAAGMDAEERTAMITGMVERLAGRLAEDGRDLDGWLRLARSYAVLGDEDKARGALASARRNFPDDAAAAARIDAAARELGLSS